MSNGTSKQAIEWAAFFADYERPLTAYAMSLAGNLEDARDLIQDVMVNLVRGDAAPTNKRQFVMKAIRNRAIDVRRGQSTRRASIERSGRGVTSLFEPDSPGDASDAVDRAERLLASLSATQREVVVLRLYASFSFADIAGVLDKPLGTITSLYARSLERMKEACQEELEDAR